MFIRFALFFVLSLTQAHAACVSSPCVVTNQAEMTDAIIFANASGTPTIINVTSSFSLTSGLPAITSNMTINGNGNTITGANVAGFNRIFMVGDTSATRITVEFNGLTLTGGYATGGAGLGGGMGAGGAVFVNANANVTATNVILTNNTARGGYGGTSANGGAMNADNVNVGVGGFGSGGGANSAGGFGGGGGTNSAGGFSSGAGNATRGGGGAGLGGAVFVREGGSFIVTNTTNNTMSGNYSVGGLGAANGQGGADGVFLQGNGTLNMSTASGTTTTINNVIADQTGGNNALIASGMGSVPNFVAGSYALIKDGTGKLVINSTLAIAGGTTINAGTLSIGSGGTTGLVFGNIAVSSGANVTYNHSDALPFTNIISGAGSVTQAGTGTLTLSSSNTYSGGTNLNAGKVSITSDSQLGASTGAINFNGGTLLSTGTITSARGGTVTAASTIDTGNTLKLGGVFTGAGSLTIKGAGYTYLTNDNTYSGATTINSGAKLVLGDNSTTGSLAGAIVDNGALIVSRSNSFTFNNTLTGTGSFEKLGTGTMLLESTLANSGTKTISAGAIEVGNAGSLGTGSITNNAALTYNRADDVSVANSISGTGTFTKLGTNALTLTGASSYSGVTNVNAGTLIVNGSIANSNVIVASGATLGGASSPYMPHFKDVTNNGIVNPGGTGTTIGHIGVGGNFVNNGTLAIDITTGSYDTLQINGNATLGGTLNLRPTGGGFTAGQTFYIVNTPSAGNLQGTKFTNMTVTGSFGNLRPVISYANDDISITLQQASIAALLASGTGSNIFNTAKAIDTMLAADKTSPIFDALFNFPVQLCRGQ
jgi:fibronectin-binding autotransporter adhesin